MRHFSFVFLGFAILGAGDPPVRTRTQVVHSGHTTRYLSNVYDGRGHVTRYNTRVTQHGNRIQTQTRVSGWKPKK